MDKTVRSQLIKLDKQELKLLNKQPGVLKQKAAPLVSQLEQKIPPGLRESLEKAFEKAFKLVFEKGTGVIEKVSPRDNIAFEHELSNFGLKNSSGFFSKSKNLRRMDKIAGKRKNIGKSIAFVEGAGLGFLGVGIPDIPVFLSVLLRGIYETALSYGFDYNKPTERLFILKLIQAAAAEADFEKHKKNIELNNWDEFLKNNGISQKLEDGTDSVGEKLKLEGLLEAEIKNTAGILSEYMLFAKFIQGIPLIGAAGSVFNFQIYSKFSDYATLKYKRRYLQKL